MKHRLRNMIAKISSYMEIYLSVIILAGVVAASTGLFVYLFKLLQVVVNPDLFRDFLGYALVLIIAVEFIKMLSKHTPGSAIEVLTFAIARKLIVKENISALDLLLGVIAIALLLWLRNYVAKDGKNGNGGVILSAATRIKEVNKLVGLQLSEAGVATLGGLLFQTAQQQAQKLQEGESIWIDTVRFRINRFRDGVIEQVEIFKDESH
jgi:uncharacterized membrane protein (DUF373 family)